MWTASLEPENGHVSVQEYAASLTRGGTRTLPGSAGHFWVSYEGTGIVRMPTFYSAEPAPSEVRNILRRGKAAVVSFIVPANDRHPGNTWLYVCRDRSYNVEKLSKPAQRCVKRAAQNLRFAWVDLATLLREGFPAYRDTRSRVGLSDGTYDRFQRRFRSFARSPAHRFLGAWHGTSLAAFMSLIVVEDWVEIPGSFSVNAHLDLRPNDGLVHQVLDHFLVRSGFSVVSYGLSSIQESADNAGLHAFKTKVGFEVQLVHRAFVLHSLLRPFANRLALLGVRTALGVFPKGRLLRKIGGVLASVSTSS